MDFDDFFAVGRLYFEIARHEHAEKIVMLGQDVKRASGVDSTDAIGLAFEIDFERGIDFTGDRRLAAMGLYLFGWRFCLHGSDVFGHFSYLLSLAQ